MVEVDWGDVVPKPELRERVEQRTRDTPNDGLTIGVRRAGRGYEAALEGGAPTEMRLRGSDLGTVVDRAIELVDVVSAPRT